jgi:hypothetical protein
MKCATQRCENTVANPGDHCEECRTTTIQCWCDPIGNPRVNGNKCVVHGCGREAVYHLCENHAVPGMVVDVEGHNECYVISAWLAEREGRMDIILLNDYALGDLFGGRELFEKRLSEQGFKVHHLISNPDDFETVKRRYPEVQAIPWSLVYTEGETES